MAELIEIGPAVKQLIYLMVGLGIVVEATSEILVRVSLLNIDLVPSEGVKNVLKVLLNPLNISCAIGIVLAMVYSLDAFIIFGLTTQVSILGKVITGLAFARGSNLLHDAYDFIDKISGAFDKE